MRQFRIWIGTAVSMAFLVLLLRRVDGAEVLQSLRGVHLPWLLLAGAAFACSLGVRVQRWRTILDRVLPIPASDAAELLVIGCAANNILPARTGEVVRAALLQRRHGGSMVTALGTIVVERVFDGLILALMLALTLAFLGSNAVLRGLALIAGAAFGAVALMLLLLALRPRLARGVIDAVLSLPPARIGDRLRALAARFLDGLTLLGGPRTWGAVAATSAATWVLEAVTYWLVGIAFGLPLSPLVYLAVCGAANLTVAAPSTSGGIGPYEFFAREVVVSFGVGAAAGTAYAIALHAFVLLPVTLVGVLLLWRRDLGLGDLAQAGRTGRARAATEASR
ncbi:MAG: lysylphosphatidylglycerol synthase transmembrane domain-containing protein [Dehalococcoidia bacterium]